MKFICFFLISLGLSAPTCFPLSLLCSHDPRPPPARPPSRASLLPLPRAPAFTPASASASARPSVVFALPLQ
jgi:hypothetical protein